jgi:hypothetical protein
MIGHPSGKCSFIELLISSKAANISTKAEKSFLLKF